MKVFNSLTKFKTPIIDAISTGVNRAKEKKELPRLTHAQLINWLKQTPGAILMGIESLTDTKARKTNNPYSKILKRSKFIGMTGVSYEKATNKAAAAQGVKESFKAESLPWGVWFIPNTLITHKGEFYLRFQSTHKQRAKSKRIILDYRNEKGQIIPREEAEKFIPAPSVSAKQQNMGIEQTVEVRTMNLNSIRKIRIMGTTYQLVK